MTEQEEEFAHFVYCITWLNNAWSLLHLIKQQVGNPLLAPAFRFALVEYCKPYKFSRGVNRNFKLDTTHIPNEHLPLHQQIIASRDQVHAHSDLSVMQAKLHVHESMGQRYTLISQNIIPSIEGLPNVDEVIALVEGTLDNIYVHQKVLEAALPR